MLVEERERRDTTCSNCGAPERCESCPGGCGWLKCECGRCYTCTYSTCNCHCCSECGEYPCDCEPCEDCGEVHCVCGLPNSPAGTSGSAKQAGLRRGLQPERNIHQHVADYYLTSYLWSVEKYAPAYQYLHSMANELAPELATYLDLACGGEIRHGDTGYFKELEASPISNLRGGRGPAWDAWADWKNPVYRAEYAKRVFFWDHEWDDSLGEWKRKTSEVWPGNGYGGVKWGQIADTLHMYLTKKLTRVAFLDRVWNLQHNGGCALNKVYQVSGINTVLEAHGNDDYSTMLRYASAVVVEMWDRNKRWKARELGPDEKLGLQRAAIATTFREREIEVLSRSVQGAEEEERQYILDQARQQTVWWQAYKGKWGD